jgi:ABC-type lipoprotein release transport system permease subunit
LLRLIWDELRRRRRRSAALAAGILVAAVSFSLLTAATDTQTAQVTGTVQRNLRPAYDILVRPRGSETALEKSQDLVEDNYLSGIFGGITIAQYQAIKKIPGVEIAAPIAMIGYVLETVAIPVDVTSVLDGTGAQVLTLTDTRVADRGLTRLPAQGEGYIYVTPDPLTSQLQLGVPITVTPGSTIGETETLPDGSTINVCQEYLEPSAATSPFADTNAGLPFCFSEANGLGVGTAAGLPSGHVGAFIWITFPFMLAAIDPQAEQQLVGLGGAVVQGRYLTAADGPTVTTGPAQYHFALHPQVPVLATTDPYDDDQDAITVSRLPASAVNLVRAGMSPDQLVAALAAEPATPVMHTTITSSTAFSDLLQGLGTEGAGIGEYWTGGPIQYQELSGGVLSPLPVTNPDSVWSEAYGGGLDVLPLDNSDVGYRALQENLVNNQGTQDLAPSLVAVGEFDPSKLPGFNPLSALPLETYYPPTATGANAASRQALGNQPLLPDANVAGYLQEPPLMLTTLSSLSAFENGFPTGDWAAPISTVRVRVGGIHGTVKQELGEIAGVAAAIQKATGLQVDITAGSSPTTETIALPAGKFGRPALLLDESWVRKAVALVIVAALDRKSVALFALILLVTALFLANGAVAAVRAKRSEIGVLRCLGWPRSAIFRLILGQLLLLGALAGLAGSALSAALIAGLHLQMPLWRVALVTPVAVALAGLAGLVPAWLATRGEPLDAVAPAVIAPRRRVRPVRRPAGLAWSNLRRRPARAALAAAALAIGITALTVLLAIDLAFSQQVTGSLLGNFVSGEVRGVDYLSAGLAVFLGTASVADVLYLNLGERAPELAALAATGWRRSDLARIAVYEGAGIGLLGSLGGGIAGIAISWALGGSPLGLLAAAAIAVAAGIALAVAASWAVVTGITRQTIAAAIAEE